MPQTMAKHVQVLSSSALSLGPICEMNEEITECKMFTFTNMFGVSLVDVWENSPNQMLPCTVITNYIIDEWKCRMYGYFFIDLKCSSTTVNIVWCRVK